MHIFLILSTREAFYNYSEPKQIKFNSILKFNKSSKTNFIDANHFISVKLMIPVWYIEQMFFIMIV